MGGEGRGKDVPPPITITQPKSSEISEKESTLLAPPESSMTSMPNKKQLKKPEQRPSLRTNLSSASFRAINSSPAYFNSQLPSPANPGYQLCLWTPSIPSTRATGDSNQVAVSNTTLNHIPEVIWAFWVDSTKNLYGNALLIYHVYCDLNGPIPNHKHCPILGTLLLIFVFSCVEGISGSTLVNYAAGIKA
ncbi:hypothetical protein J3R82DRAFT_1631 [Butyriboletus roseoflavus]|nr:hypothetical protein J3R82DRAFT_1631 [Butyriboletus roseoflavus]